MDQELSQPKYRWLYPVLLVAVIFLVFHPVLRNEFVNWDDQTEIYQNPDLNPVTSQGMLWNWSHTRMSLYMPVTYTVWGLVASTASRDVHGVLQPAVFHFFSLILHSTCSILLYALLRRLSAAARSAFFGSLIFAVHPIQTEAIAWASGMYTLLSTALGLIAIHLYFASREAKRRRILYVAATFVFSLALLTKAAGAAVPLMVLGIELTVLRRTFRSALRGIALWVVLCIPIIVLAKCFQDVSTVPTPPFWARPIIVADSFGFYFFKLILPLQFIPDYGRNPNWVLTHLPSVIPSVVAGSVLLIISLFFARRHPLLSGGIIVFIAAILPYSGLTTFDFQYVSTVADRYTYLGLVGVAIFITAIAWRGRVLPTIFIAIVVILSFLSWQQTQIWRNTDRLFFHTLSVNPDSLVAESVLGYEAKQQGRLTEARARYEHAVQIWPDDSAIHFGLGNLNLDSDPEAAAVEYRIAIRIQPKSPIYHNSLAEALRRAGDLRGAFDEFSRAIAYDPNYADAHANLGNMLLSAGQLDRAQSEFETALSLKPDSSIARRGLDRVRQMMIASPESLHSNP